MGAEKHEIYAAAIGCRLFTAAQQRLCFHRRLSFCHIEGGGSLVLGGGGQRSTNRPLESEVNHLPIGSDVNHLFPGSEVNHFPQDTYGNYGQRLGGKHPTGMHAGNNFF